VIRQSDGFLVAAVTQGLGCTGFATAKIHLLALGGAVLDWYKAAAFVGTVTKRLRFALATRTPPIVFALLNRDCEGCVGSANRVCHEISFLSTALEISFCAAIARTVSLCRKQLRVVGEYTKGPKNALLLRGSVASTVRYFAATANGNSAVFEFRYLSKRVQRRIGHQVGGGLVIGKGNEHRPNWGAIIPARLNGHLTPA
jgi:hypothetical protein